MKIDIITNNNIFSAFAKKNLVYGNKKANHSLSNEIEKWAWLNQNLNFEVLVSTFLCQKSKRKGSDVENLLFYNLNNKLNMNTLISKFQKITFQYKLRQLYYLKTEISKVNKIIFQCVDKLKENSKNNWSKDYMDYPFYYFYGLFDGFDENGKNYEKYLLYTCKCDYWMSIELQEIQKLLYADGVEDKRKLVDNIRKNGIQKPKVNVDDRYSLKIKIPDNLIYDIESLKKYLDCIVVYLNAKNIIQHPTRKIVNNRGYNPSDDVLYYCEIEKNNPDHNKIEVCVCPISNNSQADESCCYKVENLKNYPGFEKINQEG